MTRTLGRCVDCPWAIESLPKATKVAASKQKNRTSMGEVLFRFNETKRAIDLISTMESGKLIGAMESGKDFLNNAALFHPGKALVEPLERISKSFVVDPE